MKNKKRVVWYTISVNKNKYDLFDININYYDPATLNIISNTVYVCYRSIEEAREYLKLYIKSKMTEKGSICF